MDYTLDKFQKLESTCKNIDNTRENNSLLDKIENLTRNLQLTETQIQDLKSNYNSVLSENKKLESQLESKISNLNNSTTMTSKISFEK